MKKGQQTIYHGLSLEAAQAKAKQLGYLARLVRNENEYYPITKDLRSNRVNFEIDNQLVTSAKIY